MLFHHWRISSNLLVHVKSERYPDLTSLIDYSCQLLCVVKTMQEPGNREHQHAEHEVNASYTVNINPMCKLLPQLTAPLFFPVGGMLVDSFRLNSSLQLVSAHVSPTEPSPTEVPTPSTPPTPTSAARRSSADLHFASSVRKRARPASEFRVFAIASVERWR